MAGFLGLDELFEGRHFDREVIVPCVRWYPRFKLSYRDLVEMMAERGLHWLTRQSRAGCAIPRRSSNAAGTGSPDRQGHHGLSTRLTCRSVASECTCTGPWMVRVRPWISA